MRARAGSAALWGALALAIAVALGGCGPPDAPKDLDAFTHYLFREWGAAEPKTMEDGVLGIDALLAALPLDGGLGDRSFRVTPLAVDDLHDIAWPMTRDPKKAIGSCVARRSKWPMADQAKLITSADQLDAEPSAKSYLRRFLDPTDPACFVDRSCGVLLTDNDITRENTLLQVSYTMHKDLRWVRLDADRWAIAARSFIDRKFPGNKSGTAMQQSYSIDVLLGQSDERAIRYQCSWAETDLNLAVDDDLTLAVLVGAVDDALAAADSAIEKRFHAQ